MPRGSKGDCDVQAEKIAYEAIFGFELVEPAQRHLYTPRRIKADLHLVYKPSDGLRTYFRIIYTYPANGSRLEPNILPAEKIHLMNVWKIWILAPTGCYCKFKPPALRVVVASIESADEIRRASGPSI